MENNTTQLKKFTPETMKEIVYVTWPTLAPAGDKAAWVDWKGDMKSGLFSSKIHLMENLLQNATGAEGMDAARKESVLTPDGVKEKQPVFLSDGVHMAYLSNETGEFQVFIKNVIKNLCIVQGFRYRHPQGPFQNISRSKRADGKHYTGNTQHSHKQNGDGQISHACCQADGHGEKYTADLPGRSRSRPEPHQ